MFLHSNYSCAYNAGKYERWAVEGFAFAVFNHSRNQQKHIFIHGGKLAGRLEIE